MKDPHFFQSSFNRPNLIYEVRECKDKEKISFIGNFVKVFFFIFHYFLKEKYRNKSGIIYCSTREKCENVASELKSKYRIEAEAYHGSLPDE